MKIEYKTINIEKESIDIPENINNNPYEFFSLFLIMII